MKPDCRRAILLDDEPLIRALLENILKSCGYSVKSYSAPTEEAIFNNPDICPAISGRGELFNESPSCAELIISDVKMPVINGIEYIKKIRQAGCRVKHIAMMSGAWNQQKILEAEALGCKIFHKPFTVAEMREWVLSLDD